MEINQMILIPHTASYNTYINNCTENVIKKYSSCNKAFQMYNKLKGIKDKFLKSLEISDIQIDKVGDLKENFHSYMKISIAKSTRSPECPKTFSLEGTHTLSKTVEKKSESLNSRQPFTLSEFLKHPNPNKYPDNIKPILQELSELIDNLKIKRQMKCSELINLFPETLMNYEDESLGPFGPISSVKTDKSYTLENTWELESLVHNLCQIIKWLAIYLDVPLPFPILFGKSYTSGERKLQSPQSNPTQFENIHNTNGLTESYSPSINSIELPERREFNISLGFVDLAEMENVDFDMQNTNTPNSTSWFKKFTNNLLSRTFWNPLSLQMTLQNFENIDKNIEFYQEEDVSCSTYDEKIRGSNQTFKGEAPSIQILNRLSSWKHSTFETNRSPNFQGLMKHLDDNLYELCLRQGYYTTTKNRGRTLPTLIGLLNYSEFGCFVPKPHRISSRKTSEDSDNDWIII